MCAAILAALMVAGCGEDTVKPISRNLPPETIASLPDDLDPDHQVPYTQTLSWWGEDVDGEVTHYLFRFLYDVDEWCAPDSAWHRTTATESTFYLPVTDGQAAHSFEVKAVDDDGAEDPTPARVNLYVRNSPPEVFFGEPRLLPDTTLTAVSFSWTGRDTVDGSETIREYLIWLDGEETPRVVDRLVTSYTFLREDLEDPSIPAGGGTTRTVYIQAVDSGCDTSETLSHAWYVRQPNGRILLVDDVPNRLLGAILSDQFYRQTLNTLADEGEPYTLLEFETHGEFVRVEDVYPNLEPFDVVLWYTGRDSMGSEPAVRRDRPPGIPRHRRFAVPGDLERARNPRDLHCGIRSRLPRCRGALPEHRGGHPGFQFRHPNHTTDSARPGNGAGNTERLGDPDLGGAHEPGRGRRHPLPPARLCGDRARSRDASSPASRGIRGLC